MPPMDVQRAQFESQKVRALQQIAISLQKIEDHLAAIKSSASRVASRP